MKCLVDVSQVAMKHPAAVTACNVDLENLITDTNRSIATLAITTLLKVTIQDTLNSCLICIKGDFMHYGDIKFQLNMIIIISCVYEYFKNISLCLSVCLSLLTFDICNYKIEIFKNR